MQSSFHYNKTCARFFYQGVPIIKPVWLTNKQHQGIDALLPKCNYEKKYFGNQNFRPKQQDNAKINADTFRKSKQIHKMCSHVPFYSFTAYFRRAKCVSFLRCFKVTNDASLLLKAFLIALVFFGRKSKGLYFFVL